MTGPNDAAPLPAPSDTEGLKAAAASGTGWTAVQGLLNKVATMVATFFIQQQLSPDEFGMATLVVAIAGFVVLLPPIVMGDVLITHQRRFATLSRLAGRWVLGVGIATTLLFAALSPVLAAFYEKYAFATLVGLIIVYSCRPAAESLLVLPLSRLRISLRYRAIAFIDGTVQLAATGATVALAFMDAGAMALVAPQVVAVAARAVCYRIACSGGASAHGAGAHGAGAYGPHHARTLRGTALTQMRTKLLREFTTAGSAQYLHTLIGWVPVLILGRLSNEDETGYFGFSFLLANQASYVISFQLGTVLQPIFGRLKHEPERQASGFLRVVRAVGALAVPVSFLQAALAAPLFLLVFEPKWEPATNVFAVLCIGQAFYFAMAPAMALLKAQGRFKAFFIWQAVQLVASLALYPLAALWGHALGVAICDTIFWGVSVPVAVWLGTRIVRGGALQALGIFVVPWTTALPIAAGAWGAWLLLRPYGLWGMLISLFVVGPVALVISVWATKFSQPATYAELQPMFAKIAGKITRKITRRAAK